MKQTTIRLPEKLHEQLKREAEQKGMTLNAYVIGVLWDRKEKNENTLSS